MVFLKIFAGFVVVVCVLFLLLGLKSQKGAAPGLINGELAEVGAAPNMVSSESETQPEKKVAPLKGSLADIRAAIVSTGGTVTAETDSYLSATYMTKIFKFVDDVEIRRETETLWHIRSASRVGYSDRGVNRKRVETIRAILGR